MHADVTVVRTLYDLLAEAVSAVRALFAVALTALSVASAGGGAQDGLVPFDSGRWTMTNAKVVEHLGRPSLVGTALLPDARFEDGVIEYDVAVTGARSYPGIVFRSQPDGSWERFYIRPHRSGAVPPSLYPDVLQYVPAWHNVDAWQLYSGPGYTAPAVIPAGRWVHVRIEVLGTQARVFLDNAATPALVVPDLRHGRRTGGLGLMGPADGTAFVSNFAYRADPGLRFDPLPHRPVQPGFVRRWELSQTYPALEADPDAPLSRRLADAAWAPVEADDYGLVDVGRYRLRKAEPEIVYARTTMRAERDEVRAFRLGYSDIVEVFLNGAPVFTADSVYTGRDPSFLGIIGLNDTLHLPLRAGENQVVLAVAEVTGGWGFTLQDAKAEFAAPGVTRDWATGKVFAVPESVAYDPASRSIFVSNFDGYNPSGPDGRQAILRMRADGTGEAEVFARGVRNPTGLAVVGASLFAVEPTAVVTIDTASGRVTAREQVPGAVRLNDIAVSPDGSLYVSDSQRGAIHRRVSGRWELWLEGPAVSRPNGVCVSGGRLVWGNNGDGTLEAADLATKAVTKIADLPGGIIDGIANGPGGTLLVSHNEGRLYRVDGAGEVVPLLDLTVVGTNIADFAFVPETGQVIFPTFLDNRVMAVRVAPSGRPARPSRFLRESSAPKWKPAND